MTTQDEPTGSFKLGEHYIVTNSTEGLADLIHNNLTLDESVKLIEAYKDNAVREVLDRLDRQKQTYIRSNEHIEILNEDPLVFTKDYGKFVPMAAIQAERNNLKSEEK